MSEGENKIEEFAILLNEKLNELQSLSNEITDFDTFLGMIALWLGAAIHIGTEEINEVFVKDKVISTIISTIELCKQDPHISMLLKGENNE